jgi:hypothetical protein
VTIKPRQRLGDSERFSRVVDGELVNVEPIPVEDRFAHHIGFSITSTAASG